MGKNTNKTKAATIMEMLNKGMSVREISKYIPVSYSYVWKLNKQMAHTPDEAAGATEGKGHPITLADLKRDVITRYEASTKLTGGSSDYYKVRVASPTSGNDAYTAECNDIIEALGMNYAEGNAFKAVWRRAALRMGKGKPGSTLLYDSEKVEFFGKRLVEQAREAQ